MKEFDIEKELIRHHNYIIAIQVRSLGLLPRSCYDTKGHRG